MILSFGRGDEVHMYPLTLAEYMSVYSGDRTSTWRVYVIYGGLPLIFSFQTPEQKSNFLKTLFVMNIFDFLLNQGSLDI